MVMIFFVFREQQSTPQQLLMMLLDGGEAPSDDARRCFGNWPGTSQLMPMMLVGLGLMMLILLAPASAER